MACYISRTYEERRTIQRLWEAGVQAKEIADKLEAPLSSIYSELPMRTLPSCGFNSHLSGEGAGPGKARTGKEQTKHEQL